MSETSHEKIETLAHATHYLEGLINLERRPDFDYARLDLAAVDAILEDLGRPQDSLRVLHIAGSKGKGSTCLFAEACLLALGDTVGTFTSPHLESWTERFRINGEPISESRLVSAVNRCRPIVERLRTGPRETRPSFFDATTAVALLLFADARVDVAILEVGLGGRLDSTNIVSPAVTCITSIELEHTDKLGETEPEIAAEKAGIVKPDVPLVLGPLRAGANDVIRRRALELGAPLRAFGEAFEASQAGRPIELLDTDSSLGRPFRFRAAPHLDFEVSLFMPGRPALVNAALAIECVRALGRHHDSAIGAVAPQALGQVRLPGRIELLGGDPAVIIDSAHTTESARALVLALKGIAPGGFELLISVSADKKLVEVLDALLPRARRVWVTRAESLRSLPADVLAREIRERDLEIPIEVIDDPEKATRQARATLAPGDHLCVTGSIYLAGIARRVLRETPPGPMPE